MADMDMVLPTTIMCDNVSPFYNGAKNETKRLAIAQKLASSNHHFGKKPNLDVGSEELTN